MAQLHCTVLILLQNMAGRQGAIRSREFPIPSFSSFYRRCSVIGTFWPKPASSGSAQVRAGTVICVSAAQRDLSVLKNKKFSFFFAQSSCAIQPEGWRIISDPSHSLANTKATESLIREHPNFGTLLSLYQIRGCFLRS